MPGAPSLSRSLRQGGDFDFLLSSGLIRFNIPALSRQDPRDKDGAPSAADPNRPILLK